MNTSSGKSRRSGWVSTTVRRPRVRLLAAASPDVDVIVLSEVVAGGPRGVGESLVERLAIPDAPAQELRPSGDLGKRIGGFREQTPEVGMVPAEIVAGGVAMAPDLSKALHLPDEIVVGEGVEVLVHHARDASDGVPYPRVRRAPGRPSMAITGVASGSTLYFGIRTLDVAGNISALSNVACLGRCRS